LLGQGFGFGESKNRLRRRSGVSGLRSTERVGDELKISVLLKNQQPHSLPTGAPFRNVYMTRPEGVGIPALCFWSEYKLGDTGLSG
jgi:hypothetical protein